MNIRNLLTVLCLMFPPISGIASESCLQSHEEIHYRALRVQTCLVGDADSKSKVPRARIIKQTLVNMADQTIELQLDADPVDQFGIAIYEGSRVVSKSMRVPIPDAHDAKQPMFVFHELAPGQSMQLEYVISQFMTEPAKKKVRYHLAINSIFPFRYLNETKGHAYSLRRAEARERKEFRSTDWFHDVRLQ